MSVALRFVAGAAALVAACTCDPAPKDAPPRPARGLVAAVADGANVLVLRDEGGGFVVEKRLPPSARALRFSADGTTVAWVQDERRGDATVPVAFTWGARESAAVELGVLGLRAKEAMGLAVGPDGRVAWMDAKGDVREHPGARVVGAGRDALPGENGATAWVEFGTHCLAIAGAKLAGRACDASLRPLEWRDGVLLARTNSSLLRIDAQTLEGLPLTEVLDARRGPANALLVLRRTLETGVVYDELLVQSDVDQRPVLRAAVVVSAGWDEDGSVLAVRRTSRRDLYELLLAHAPEEFGGEASDGDAVRIDPTSGVEQPVRGLELKRVRALFRAR